MSEAQIYTRRAMRSSPSSEAKYDVAWVLNVRIELSVLQEALGIECLRVRVHIWIAHVCPAQIIVNIGRGRRECHERREPTKGS